MNRKRIEKIEETLDMLLRINVLDLGGPLAKVLNNAVPAADDKSAGQNPREEVNGAKGENSSASIAVNPDISPSRIPTVNVIRSLIKHKRNKRVKESSLETYEKRLNLFARKFPLLPETIDPVLEYLAWFDGQSGRHRRNNQDLINMLYKHAVRYFNLPKNPLEGLERPQITLRLVKTVPWDLIVLLNKMPKTLVERVVLDLLLGHGWRQIEVRRILAEDVANIKDDIILCHGKEREELAPILPETAARLRELARGLKPGDHLFVAQIARGGEKQPLGEDGMSQLVGRLFKRAGIRGFAGHDLRRTFATVITEKSKDEFLAMRLIRDVVPGMSNRYIKYPMDQLIEALKKYSPVKLAGETTENPGKLTGEIEPPDDPASVG